MGVLVIRVAEPDIEPCSDLLFQLGATAIEERDTPESCLVAGFASDDAALAARSLISERWPARLEDTGDEAAWRDVWLHHLEPVTVGPFDVRAPWHSPAGQPDSDRHQLIVDPGRAFGSGHHPTTRLALHALADTVEAGQSCLDVGCGTGILAIAAALLGATDVLGVDLDHDIITVASANAEANAVDEIVTVATTPLCDIERSRSIVIANIVVGELRPLLNDLVALAEQTVILTGFLSTQVETILALTGTPPHILTTDGEWACLRFGSAHFSVGTLA